jgi:hypothetical protein
LPRQDFGNRCSAAVAQAASLPSSSESTGRARSRRNLPVDQWGDRRAALVVAALQRVAQLEHDDRPDTAQIEPRRRPLAAGVHVRQEALDVDVAATPAQPHEAAVVRVAELAATNTNERAARDAAFADAGAGRAGLADEVLQARLARVTPAAVVGATQRAVVRRARAARRGAGRDQPAVTQPARTVPQRLGLWRLPVAAPHPGVPVAEMAALPVGALEAAGVAALDQARRAEQHRVAGLGEVDVDLELRPHARAQQLLPAVRTFVGPLAWHHCQTAGGHVSAPSRCSTPARSSSARRSSGDACR